MKLKTYLILFNLCILQKINKVFKFNFTSNYTGLSHKENLYFFVVD